MHKRLITLLVLCLTILTGCRKNTAEPQPETEAATTVTAETILVNPENEVERDIPEESTATPNTTVPETIAEEVQEKDVPYVETEATETEEIIREEIDIPEILPDYSETQVPSPRGEYELQERDL